MSLEVSILLDKIYNQNCGLGRISLDFSKALINLGDNETGLTFFVRGKSVPSHLKDHDIKRLYFYNRWFPFNLENYPVYHILHQMPSFRAKGARKTVLTLHDLNFLHVKSKIKSRRYLKRVQQNVDMADALVFVSNYSKNECFRYLTIPSGKTTCVIYNGVDLPQVNPVKPAFLNADNYLFSIGQFLAKKNFHTLIPFVKMLPSEIKLVIAGENTTSYGDYIKKMIAASNMQHRVLLPGPVSEAEKLFLYLHCTAFMFPSLAEGFGIPVLEAMRAGKPVFCSDKTSLEEIGDQHAHYWRSFDPGAMLKVYTLGMANYTEQKKQAAIDYSLKYAWHLNAREHIRLYKSLLHSS
jgi:glycosyltransferase involved in cell wall biosynthesis